MNYKNMDYKEKLEKAKELYPTANADQRYVLECLFPELAESEDEKIRKAILTGLIDCRDAPDLEWSNFGGINIDECIAWLEKQSNTIPDECVFRPVAGCDIESAAKQAIKQQGVLAKKIVLAFNGAYIPVGGKAADIIVNEYNSWLEKQGGIDNCPLECSTNTVMTDSKKNQVEPKFHEGEWVVLTPGELSTTLQIVKVDTNKRLYWFNDNSYLPLVDEECLYHWTIQDAKDGDVLVTKEDGRPFIFNGLLDKSHPESPVAYCGIDDDDDFFVSISGDKWWTGKEVCPSTKEQRALLFQKMKEAGYEWDAEKKSILAWGDKNPACSEENSAWNEKDDNNVKQINEYLKDLFDDYRLGVQELNDYETWLKSLKQRIGG